MVNDAFNYLENSFIGCFANPGVAATAELRPECEQCEVVEKFLGDATKADHVRHFRSASYKCTTKFLHFVSHPAGHLPLEFQPFKSGEFALVIKLLLAETEQQR
jgi:hypothetical protein